ILRFVQYVIRNEIAELEEVFAGLAVVSEGDFVNSDQHFHLGTIVNVVGSILELVIQRREQFQSFFVLTLVVEAFGPSDVELDILRNRTPDLKHPGRESDQNYQYKMRKPHVTLTRSGHSCRDVNGRRAGP